MPSELKALIRLKKQLMLIQGVLYRRITPADAKHRLQLILPPSHHNKAIEGCHDQVGHLGQDRVLEVHAYNCTRNAATGFSPYYLLFGREPRLSVDVEFGLKRGSQRGPLGESNYVTQLRRQLKFAHNKANLVASMQQARHKGLYDRKCRGATLDIEDLVLVKQTAWKGRHKIQDHWEEEEYQVVDQPTPGVPVYVVKSIAGGRPRVLHRILLLPPLQGRMRQEGVTGKESNPDSGSEGEASETPKATCGKPRRVSHVNPIKKRDVSFID